MRPWLSCVLLLSLAPWGRAQVGEPPPGETPDPAALKLRVVLETGGHSARVARLFFTPEGRQLVSVGFDFTIRYWDVDTGELRRTLRPRFGIIDEAGAGGVAVSPDGRLLALRHGGAHPGDRTVTLVNVPEERVERVIDVAALGKDFVVSLTFTPDGNRLVLGGYNRLVLFDLPGERIVKEVKEVAGLVTKVAVSPDGQRLAAVADGKVYLADLAGKGRSAPAAVLEGADVKAVGVAWAPDGRALAVAGANGVEVWDPQERKRLRRCSTDSAYFPTYDPRGTVLLVTETARQGSHRQVTLFDAATGKGVLQLRPPDSDKAPHATCVALSPDGKLVAASCGPRHAIYLWERDGGKLLRVMAGRGGPVNAVGWGPDGHTIGWGRAFDGSGATYSAKRPLHAAFDLRALAPVAVKPDFRPFHRAVLEQDDLKLRPERLYPVAVHADKTVPLKVWEPHGFSGTLLPADRAAIGSLHLLQFLNPKTGALLRRLYDHEDEIHDMAPSADGKYLLTASFDERLRLYNVETPGKERLLLTLFFAGPDWVVWTPNGYYAATPGGEKLMGWVADNGPDRLRSFYPAERFRGQLHRPDVIKLVLEKGSVGEALKAARIEAADVAQLLPPRASLAVLGWKDGRLRVRATADAAVPGQPVLSLRLLVDGRALPNGQGLLELKKGKATAADDWEVTLSPGEHELKVLARGPETAGLSEPVRLPRLRDATPRPRPMLHLVAVGIDAYPDRDLRLHCAVADARDLSETIARCCAGKDNLFREVRTWPDGPLLDGKATRQAVRDALQDVRKHAKREDLVVVSFAGHGFQEGKEFYLLTVDADPTNATKLAETALSGKELKAALADMPCQVLLLLDACHAGASLREFKPATDAAARQLTGDDCGVVVLGAAMGHEEAREEGGHGYFTRAVVEALSRTDQVPYNAYDHRQYVHHLHAFVFDEVQRASEGKQHPFLNLPYITESFAIRRLPEHPGSSPPGGTR